MRSVALGASLALLGVLTGCDGTPEQQLKECKNQLAIHFANLNKDAALMGIENRSTTSAADRPLAAGRTYSNYIWSSDGFIIKDAKCDVCKKVQEIVVYFGAEVKCPACGAGDMNSIEKTLSKNPLIPGGQTKDDLEKRYTPVLMFEVKNKNPLTVVVRYVRRQWVLDESAKVEPSEKGIDRAQVPQGVQGIEGMKQAGGGNFYAAGYHRQDAVFVGTTGFVFQGGSISQIDPKSAKKIADGESVGVSSMILGPATANEEFVKHWVVQKKEEKPAK